MSKQRKPRWERDTTPAQAADYLCSLEWYLEKYGHPWVVIYVRESRRWQYRRHNLLVQKKIARRACWLNRLRIICTIGEVCSGWIENADERLALIRAIQIASQQKKPTIVLAVAPDRLLRNVDYTSTHPVSPTKDEWKALRELAGNVPLVTLLNPDMTEKEIHGQRIKWGMYFKGHTGGRKRKAKPGEIKNRRIEMLPQVLKLYRKGVTVYRINKNTGIACSTIRDWLRKENEG